MILAWGSKGATDRRETKKENDFPFHRSQLTPEEVEMMITIHVSMFPSCMADDGNKLRLREVDVFCSAVGLARSALWEALLPKTDTGRRWTMDP